MLKKTANILLVLVFLITSMGFSITQHYCGNRLISVSLKHVGNCCKNCNQCHSKVTRIKITDSFFSGGGNSTLTNNSVFISFFAQNNNFSFGNNVPDHSIFSDISPPFKKSDNCFFQVFRF